MFPADFLQMSIRVHTNQEAEPNAGTHQRHKTASIFAFFQLDIVCRSRRQRFASADNGAGFIGDFAATDGRLKKRVRKPKRPVIRSHMKRVIQHKQRTFQQRSGVCGKAFQVILRKELRPTLLYYICSVLYSPPFHLLFICAESTSGFFLYYTVELFFVSSQKKTILSAETKERQ